MVFGLKTWGILRDAGRGGGAARERSERARERKGEDWENVCKVRVKRIGKGGYHRDRIGGEGEARGDGSAAK